MDAGRWPVSPWPLDPWPLDPWRLDGEPEGAPDAQVPFEGRGERELNSEICACTCNQPTG